MKVKNIYKYDFEKSIERIDSYLNDTEEYSDSSIIPNRDSLTFSNGYYVDCYAVFVDIRESSKLPLRHQKRVLARIYRSYISELTAIMQSHEQCKEVNIVGDCVSGIFCSTNKDDVLSSFSAAYRINSIVNLLNFKLQKKGFSEIEIGIGLAKGKALMILAGYKGSGLNDVVWMGDVVNQASNLCNIANKDNNGVIVISEEVYSQLSGYIGYNNVPYQDMFKKNIEGHYSGNIVDITMLNRLENIKKYYGK